MKTIRVAAAVIREKEKIFATARGYGLSLIHILFSRWTAIYTIPNTSSVRNVRSPCILSQLQTIRYCVRRTYC